jgi:hypothetical protein
MRKKTAGTDATLGRDGDFVEQEVEPCNAYGQTVPAIHIQAMGNPVQEEGQQLRSKECPEAGLEIVPGRSIFRRFVEVPNDILR